MSTNTSQPIAASNTAQSPPLQLKEHQPSSHLDDVLIETRAALYTKSKENGKIMSAGLLCDAMDNESIWRGQISASLRLLRGEITRNDIQYAKDIVSECYVFTTPGSQVRCIDGRTISGYNDASAKWFNLPMGPQSPGGTPVGGVCWRIARPSGQAEILQSDIEKDVREFENSSVESTYLPGDHVGENPKPGKTDCGAIDGLIPILKVCNKYNLLGDLESAIRLLLQDEYTYNVEHFNNLVAGTTRLLGAQASYFTDLPHIIESLKELNAKGAPVLIGPHHEVFVSVNYVPGTTLHTNHFNTRTNGKINVFNYDIWRTIDAARAMDVDEQTKSRYIHARVGMTIATLMFLTDGSLELLLRK